jgi:hypothetical protein
MSKMQNYLAGIASPVTAYLLADLFKNHEGPFACSSQVCGPDDLPAWVFVAGWVAIYWGYTKVRDM